MYVQNRYPTVAVIETTPQEAWSGHKPSIHFFRVFECLAYAHVPENKRKKRDDRSKKCVLLGISEESEAYRLFDPTSQKVRISRDVVFNEEELWNWKGKEKENNNEFVPEIETNTKLETTELAKAIEVRETAMKNPENSSDSEAGGTSQN